MNRLICWLVGCQMVGNWWRLVGEFTFRYGEQETGDPRNKRLELLTVHVVPKILTVETHARRTSLNPGVDRFHLFWKYAHHLWKYAHHLWKYPHYLWKYPYHLWKYPHSCHELTLASCFHEQDGVRQGIDHLWLASPNNWAPPAHMFCKLLV